MKLTAPLIVGGTLIVLTGLAAADITRYQSNGSRATTAGAQLTPVEIEKIIYMREEEKLARDVYLTMDNLWDADIFANIAESEQQHMNAIARLITRYGLDDPITDDTIGVFTNPVFTALYGELVAQGEVSLKDALAVGVAIEELDIKDLEAALEQTTTRSVQRVFENLLSASQNHLVAFNTCLAADGTGAGAGPGVGTCTGDGQGSGARRGYRQAGKGWRQMR
jgi:hypothetical protein